MSTQEVIDRIKALEITKEINGIIDERGKYIYITPKELESVKNYIVSKGRVARSDLIAECNRLIKLKPEMILAWKGKKGRHRESGINMSWLVALIWDVASIWL